MNPAAADSAAIDIDASTQERLLQAARASVRDVGVARTRVEEIAAAAGVTSGALYKLFANKNELVSKAIADGADIHLLDVEAVFREAAGESFVERAADALVYRFTHSTDPTGDILTMGALAAALHEPDAAEVVLPAVERLQNEVREIIGSDGGPAADGSRADLDAAVTVMASVLCGSIVMRALELSQPDPEQFRLLVTSIMHAMFGDH